jgi:hypothetical protein
MYTSPSVVYVQADGVLLMYGPSFIIIISNILIVIGVANSKETMEKSSKITKKDSNDKRMILNLLMVSTTYVVFLTPNAVILPFFYNLQSSLQDPAYMRLVYHSYQMSIQVMLMNYAFNFVIYSLTLPFYRREVETLFCVAI